MSKKTAVLLAGFGGPETPAEVRPFIQSVAQGAHIPPERLEIVVGHYEKIGGRSRYNEITVKQHDALEALFKKKNLTIEVSVGFLHSHPSFTQVFSEMKKNGIERVLVFVLSAYRSYPSFERYHERLEDARRAVGAETMELQYSAPFHDHPLFIGAVSDRIAEIIKNIPPEELSKTHFIFTAHSIPVDWAKNSDYDEEFNESAALAAKKMKLESWDIVYQSRSGPPNYPWLEPDINDAIRGLPRGKWKRVALVPIGFLSDNAEVLYDLDIKAQKTAAECGLRYSRALTVMDHPSFIEMIASLIAQRSG